GYLYASTDGGATWASTGATANAVSGMDNPLVDPADDRIVYAHQFGQRIVRSVDGGATFVPFDQGLDNAPWFYGQFRMTYVNSPAPRIVVGTLAGVYVTQVFSKTAAANAVTVAAGDVRTGLDFGTRPLRGEISG